MKKLLLLFFIFFIGFSQQGFTQDTLKTTAHHWTTELNINPLQGQINLNNAVNQIKARYFISDQEAYRVAFSINNVRKEDVQSSTYGYNAINNKDIKKSLTINLNLGREKHFIGTRRLSPYIGWELALGFKTTGEKIKTNSTVTEIKQAWEVVNGGNITYSNSDRGCESIGLNAVTGFDFYAAKHFFFGYELLFGMNYIHYNKMKVTITPTDSQTPNYGSYPDLSGNELNFGPKIINGIRLGYTF
jgi:hypothetical protein